MSTRRIDELPAAGALSSDDQVLIMQSGRARRADAFAFKGATSAAELTDLVGTGRSLTLATTPDQAKSALDIRFSNVRSPDGAFNLDEALANKQQELYARRQRVAETVYTRSDTDRAEEYGSLLEILPPALQAAVGAGDVSVPLDSYINAYYDKLRPSASAVFPTGRRIRWPAGKIRLENPLNVRGLHNIKQIGAGSGSTEVLQTINAPVFSAEYTAAEAAAGAQGTARHSIQDMTVHGSWGSNETFSRGHGVATRYTNQFRVSGVDFRGCNRMWSMAFGVTNFAEFLTSPNAVVAGALGNKYGLFQCGINPEYDNNSVHAHTCILSAREVAFRMVNAHGTAMVGIVGLASKIGMLCGRPGTAGDGDDPTDVVFLNTQFVYPHLNDLEMDSCSQYGFIFGSSAGGAISRMRMGLLWAANTTGTGMLIDGAQGLLIMGYQAVFNTLGSLIMNNSSYCHLQGVVSHGNLRDSAAINDIAVNASSFNYITNGSSILAAGRTNADGRGFAETGGSDYNIIDLICDNGRRGGMGLHSEYRGFPFAQRKVANTADTI